MALIVRQKMSDLETTQESPVYDPEADEITIRERCVPITSLDGTTQLMKISPPVVPVDPRSKFQKLEHAPSQAFDAFLYLLFEKYAGTYKQAMYSGLAEQHIRISVNVEYDPAIGTREISYQLICGQKTSPIAITPSIKNWNAFLDKTEEQVKNLCKVHIKRKTKEEIARRDSERAIMSDDEVSTRVSQTLISGMAPIQKNTD